MNHATKQRGRLLAFAASGWIAAVWIAGCAGGRSTAVPQAAPSPATPRISGFDATVLQPVQPVVLFVETFNRLDDERWKPVEVRGSTRYTVDVLEGNAVLKAASRAGASMLVAPLRVRLDAQTWLSWRWRVDQPVAGENLREKRRSDAAARVYVFFNTKGFPWQKRQLDYVWSSALPEGTVLTSPCSRAARIIVVAGSGEHLGRWQTVRRNVLSDYRRCFGQEPPEVVGIGVMTDTDNTGRDALAYYDDVTWRRESPDPLSTPETPPPAAAPAP